MRSVALSLALGLAAIGAASISGCAETAEPEPIGTEPVVMTSFYPTAYFAERISGGLVDVQLPLPEGADPVHWQPSPAVIAGYQRARLVVLNGAGLEQWAKTAALPRSRVIESASELDGPLIGTEEVTHSHGPAGEHTHGGFDPHTWTDPVNAASQAGVVAGAMAQAFPEHAAAFAANAEALEADLTALHERFAVIELPADAVLLASHPSYDYLARRHGWTIRNFDIAPDESLEAAPLAEITAIAADAEGPVLMLWESEPDSVARGPIEALGITSVLFSPAESRPDPAGGDDFLSIMTANADRLAAALAAE